VPTQAPLRQAAEVLNAGERVTLLAGAGALGALARIAALVAKPLLGKGALAVGIGAGLAAARRK